MRAYIIGSVALYRESLASVLGQTLHMQVKAGPPEPREVLHTLANWPADIVLLDAAAPGFLQLGQQITDHTQSKLLALALTENERDVIACAEYGFAGYISQNAGIDDLQRIIKSSRCGELQCSPQIAGGLLRRIHSLVGEHFTPSEQPNFTRRENQIAALLASDLTNKEIARQLNIQISTVKNHVHNVFEKLHVHSRRDAISRLKNLSQHKTFLSS